MNMHVPRKFEVGFSTDFVAIQLFLETHGFTLIGDRNMFRLKQKAAKGRPKLMRWSKVIEEVDRIRIRNGLQPVRLASLKRIS